MSQAKEDLRNCEESAATRRDPAVRVDVGARSDTGRVREGNEDRFKLLPERNLFVLSDGMGGQASGEVASYMAVEAVAAHFQDAESDPSLPLVGPPVGGLSEKTNRLASAVRLANHVIYESAQDNPERRGMGATIVAVQFDDLRMSLAAWVACPVKNDKREPALYVIPRPKALTHIKWKRETWHAKCRALNKKRVWLNAPVHHFLMPLGD